MKAKTLTLTFQLNLSSKSSCDIVLTFDFDFCIRLVILTNDLILHVRGKKFTSYNKFCWATQCFIWTIFTTAS